MSGSILKCIMPVLIPSILAISAKCDGQDLLSFSNILNAQEISKGSNTIVAVIDWLFVEDDREQKNYIHEKSMIEGVSVWSEEPWHGEWMTSIVNEVAPEAMIAPIRARAVYDENPKPDYINYENYAIEAIRYAADIGAVAASFSMGTIRMSEALTKAIDYAEAKGTIFVNVNPAYINNKQCSKEECDKRIIRTGVFTDEKHKTIPKENRDYYMWPYASEPSFKDGWGYSNGPPQLAGIIALIKSANQSLKPDDIRSILLNSSKLNEGFRVIDAEKAVQDALIFKN